MAAFEGTTSGRTASVCGQMAATTMASTLGTTIGPPADSAYAVEPVGVATTIPSAEYCPTSSPSTHAEPDHARHAALVHHGVVQHDRFGATPALLVFDERRQGETRLGDVGPAHEGVERPVEGLRGSGGQEADPTEVHPQDRCMGAVERPGPAQQGPVAAQGAQAVELGRRGSR